MATAGGLLFAGANVQAVDWYHPVSGNLQGIPASSMVVTLATGVGVVLVWEINPSGVPGESALISADPYQNGWSAGQTGTFTVTQATKVWASVLLTGPGSQGDPVSLAVMAGMYPNNTLLKEGVSLAAGSTSGQSSLVSGVAGCVSGSFLQVGAGTPTVTGTPVVGGTLGVNPGSWTPAGVTFTYQWLLDGAPIDGATAATYSPVFGDGGHKLSVTLTGSASGYASASATSAQTATVPEPVTPGTVTITGTAAVSGTLTAQPGSWTPAGVVFTYQWNRAAAPISGATGSSYAPTPTDVGKVLTVAVTGAKDGYVSVTQVSGPTAAIQSSTSTLAYEAFVKASYQDFLGRAPSVDEVAFQATALSQGRVSKANYLASLSTSDEWLRAIVTKMYRDTLSRDPDAAGLATWVSWLRSGRFTVAEVASRFYASNEYYSAHAGNTAASWVTLLYQKLLNRDPDAQGLQLWITLTNDPSHGRDFVAYNFYQSEESRMRRVEALYQALLSRQPDSVGLPYWTARVLTAGDLTLAWEIATSQEYWDRAHARY
jgi:hypothetical protein